MTEPVPVLDFFSQFSQEPRRNVVNGKQGTTFFADPYAYRELRKHGIELGGGTQIFDDKVSNGKVLYFVPDDAIPKGTVIPPKQGVISPGQFFDDRLDIQALGRETRYATVGNQRGVIVPVDKHGEELLQHLGVKSEHMVPMGAVTGKPGYANVFIPEGGFPKGVATVAVIEGEATGMLAKAGRFLKSPFGKLAVVAGVGIAVYEGTQDVAAAAENPDKTKLDVAATGVIGAAKAATALSQVPGVSSAVGATLTTVAEGVGLKPEQTVEKETKALQDAYFGTIKMPMLAQGAQGEEQRKLIPHPSHKEKEPLGGYKMPSNAAVAKALTPENIAAGNVPTMFAGLDRDTLTAIRADALTHEAKELSPTVMKMLTQQAMETAKNNEPPAQGQNVATGTPVAPSVVAKAQPPAAAQKGRT